MPTGSTPGLLSSATRQHAISAQYAAQGGGGVSHPVGQPGDDNSQILRRTPEAKDLIS